MGWLPFMDLSQLDRISFWQGPHKLYLRSEDIMKFRQNNPPFPPLPVHSIANYLSFHPSIQPFIHSLALPNNVDSSRACPIVLFLRPGYPGTCIPMYTTMSLKFFGRHFSVDQLSIQQTVHYGWRRHQVRSLCVVLEMRAILLGEAVVEEQGYRMLLEIEAMRQDDKDMTRSRTSVGMLSSFNTSEIGLRSKLGDTFKCKNILSFLFLSFPVLIPNNLSSLVLMQCLARLNVIVSVYQVAT